ncbi:MAG: SRPBCC family protein [Ilumatobacter sp.]|nr:SRPBCC family protein [Ilumatobacter sp.]
MEIRRSVRVPCSAERLFSWVDDLAVYPTWMRLVHDVEAVAVADGEPPAWNVELRAQVGPLARSKRLRMARTVHVPPRESVFERAEVDGRRHSPWVLRATVVDVDDEADDASTELTMELRYGGSLWTGALLQRVLDEEVRLGSDALVEAVSAEPRR